MDSLHGKRESTLSRQRLYRELTTAISGTNDGLLGNGQRSYLERMTALLGMTGDFLGNEQQPYRERTAGYSSMKRLVSPP
ncbi:MAG: hypothetical protein IJV27_06525 [Prevotella sp.]|nr:hypothetical protein [Prevotella sp.]